MIDPVLSVTPPALFIAVGVQSTADSESLHRICRGSIEEDPIGLVPKQITCLSISDIITCKAIVGALEAPATADKATPLAEVPELSSQ